MPYILAVYSLVAYIPLPQPLFMTQRLLQITYYNNLLQIAIFSGDIRRQLGFSQSF